MDFSLKTRNVRDVVVLDLSGRVTVGRSVQLLRDTVRSLADQGSTRFVVNLAAVSYIDSCGLGELVASYTSMCRRGGTISLLNPSQRASHLLAITRLSTVFGIFDDEETAVEAAATGVPGKKGQRGA